MTKNAGDMGTLERWMNSLWNIASMLVLDSQCKDCRSVDWQDAGGLEVSLTGC